MKTKYILAYFITLFLVCCHSNGKDAAIDALRSRMTAMYGVNKKLDVIPENAPVAYTATGVYVGSDSLDVMSFKGIPYATQPIGNLRWKTTQTLPSDSSTIWEAKYFGKSAVQSESLSQPASFYPQGEDCLSLNVWTTSTDSAARHPVMVYIHGGSYGWGGTSDPLFSGFNLVHCHPDIVMVSINYRLGILGFMDFSSFDGNEGYREAADLGILDQIEALKWIKQNIASFGGNPHNITIFGESAGGGSVSLLCVSPLAKGLFDKAIAESGSPAFTSDSVAYASLALKVKDKTGVSSVSDLVKYDYSQIKELSDELNEDNCFPLRDGHVVPIDPYKAYASGNARDITIMTGTNKDEVRYWIEGLGGIVPYTAALNIWTEGIYKHLPDSLKKDVDDFYNIVSGKQVWKRAEFLNELFFRVPSLTVANGHSDSGSATYVYFWTKPAPGEADKIEGACHMAELPYVFGNFANPEIATSEDRQLSKATMDMWVNFARSGSPSSQWPAYTVATKASMVIGDSIYVAHNLLGERVSLISPLMNEYISPLHNDLDFAVPYVFTAVVIIVFVIALIIVICVLVKRRKRLRR